MNRYYVFEVTDDKCFDEIGAALMGSDDIDRCIEFAYDWFLTNKRSVMVLQPEFNLIKEYWLMSQWGNDENGNFVRLRVE